MMDYQRQYGREDVDYSTWYSDWAKALAKAHTTDELRRIAGIAPSDAHKAAGAHLRAINRTSSMTSQSAARAQSRNVVAAAGERARAARAALEIHELFPEHAKSSKASRSAV